MLCYFEYLYFSAGCQLASRSRAEQLKPLISQWQERLKTPQVTDFERMTAIEAFRGTNLDICRDTMLLLAFRLSVDPASRGETLENALNSPRDGSNALYYQRVDDLITAYGRDIVDEAWNLHIRALVAVMTTAERTPPLTLDFQKVLAVLRTLDQQIPLGGSPWHASLWYAASIIADLTYYKVLGTEIDQARMGVKILVPSDAFQTLIHARQSVTVETLEPENAIFSVATRRSVVVGLILNKRVYIGFRGTIFAYLGDWRVNCRYWLAGLASARPPNKFLAGRYHPGFSAEALRLCELVREELEKRHVQPKELVLGGHSLGGAIASIAQALFLSDGLPSVQTVTFGAPRFGDKEVFRTRRRLANALPVQIVRPLDLTPMVPFRICGYADPDAMFLPNSKTTAPPPTAAHDLVKAIETCPVFFGTVAKPHEMEKYRRDAQPPGSEYELGTTIADLTKISKKDFRAGA